MHTLVPIARLDRGENRAKSHKSLPDTSTRMLKMQRCAPSLLLRGVDFRNAAESQRQHYPLRQDPSPPRQLARTGVLHCLNAVVVPVLVRRVVTLANQQAAAIAQQS